ncbi:hemolymph juvenile hormone-binding protein, partial [Oryctes borbonicus]
LDLANQKAGFVGIADTITILATYSIENGKIQSRPVSGSGAFNMTLAGIILDFRCGATAEVRDGLQYLQISDPTVDTKIERAYYKFENLQSPSGKVSINKCNFNIIRTRHVVIAIFQVTVLTSMLIRTGVG